VSRIPQALATIAELAGPPLPFPGRSVFAHDRLVKVYLRVGPRVVPMTRVRGWFVTIASIEVLRESDYRKGLCREVIAGAEAFVASRADIMGVFVECVNNEVLLPFLTEIGYSPRPDTDVLGGGLGADWYKVINRAAGMSAE
jgi:hypothetical protein